jgi:hypothetical protein
MMCSINSVSLGVQPVRRSISFAYQVRSAILPPALLIYLCLDTRDNAFVMISSLFGFIWLAALLAHKRVVRKEIVTEINSGITP